MIGKIIGIGAAVLIGGVVLTYIGTAGFLVTAPARVITKTFETDNIINSYAQFKILNNEIIARVAQISEKKVQLSDEQKDTRTPQNEIAQTRTDLGVSRQSCRQMVADYNTSAQRMDKNIFRVDAPPSQDTQQCEI